MKSPEMGSQSFLFAAMEERFGRRPESDTSAEIQALLIKECKARPFLREDVMDEAAQGRLWNYSEKMVEEAEKRGAVKRAESKKAEKDRKEEEEAVQEIGEYKEKVGKRDGKKTEGSRRSKKAS